MYTIRVKGEFSSAHNLKDYKGKCEKLHGHNWKVEAEIGNNRLDQHGMIMDFRRAKDILNSVLDMLDHKYLNTMPFFKKHNPTSEIVAKFIYDEISKQVTGLTRITVWETDSSSASYFVSRQ